MRRYINILLNIDGKLRKYSFYIPLLTSINIIVFVYLLVLVTHPSKEVINIVTSILTVVITCVGFYLVYVNLKAIDESNKVNKSMQIYDYYLKRIEGLSKEVESYSFSNYIFYDMLDGNTLKGMLNPEPVLKLYFFQLECNDQYIADRDKLLPIL